MKITLDLHMGDTFDSFDADNLAAIDIDASHEKYAGLVIEEIRRAYGDAVEVEIEVYDGQNGHAGNYNQYNICIYDNGQRETDSDDVQWIEQAIGEAWQQMDIWIVLK